FYGIAQWLAAQATGNGADIRVSTEGGVDATEGFDHVVVATGARYSANGFQGQTAGPLPGHETGRCVAWDAVALGKESPSGKVLVIDDLQDAAAPLTAIKLAEEGSSVRLVTRWP